MWCSGRLGPLPAPLPRTLPPTLPGLGRPLIGPRGGRLRTVDVLLVLLGAVAGWLGSITGSVIVGRRELTRTARIRIYRELLPPLVDATLDAAAWSTSTSIPRSKLEELYREGILAGHREATLAERAVEAWVERAAVPIDDQTDEYGNAVSSAESFRRWGEANQALLTKLVEMETFVKKKVR